MAAAIGWRCDYSAADLRVLARWCEDADRVRRLLAIAMIVEGASRSEAARAGKFPRADPAKPLASLGAHAMLDR